MKAGPGTNFSLSSVIGIKLVGTNPQKLVLISYKKKAPLFDLAENLAQCSQYHREQLCNWSKVGRSLGSTSGGQIPDPCACVKDMGKKRALREGFLSLTLMLFA